MAGQLSKLVRDLHGLHTHASSQRQGQRPPPPFSDCHTTACLLSNREERSAAAAQQDDSRPALSACTHKQAGTWQEGLEGPVQCAFA